MPMNLDVLVFAAHPDDAELAMGGTIAKLSANNLKVGIIDFTRGEMGTRGTAEARQKEAFKAAGILKAALRENLSIPDGSIEQQFRWLKRNYEKLVKPVAPSTAAGKLGAGGSTVQIELSPEESAIAKKFGMTDEEYFKYKEK